MTLVPEELRLLAALVAGAAVGGGLFLFAAAIRGFRPRPPRPATRRFDMASMSARIALAVVAGFVVLLLTRWVAAGIGAALLVLAWHGLVGGAAEERAAMRRLEALAAWTESLRDTIAGAAGLEQAIPVSVRAAAPSLQPHLRALVDRLHTRMPLPEALQRFADDLDDPSADLVVAALILNAKLRGPGMREVLGALAVSAREELDMRRRVEAERRSTRRSVQIVVGASLAFAVLVVLFNRQYLEPYDDVLGQLVMVVIGGLYGLGFAWMRRLARFDQPNRLLGAADVPASAEPVRGGEVAEQPRESERPREEVR